MHRRRALLVISILLCAATASAAPTHEGAPGERTPAMRARHPRMVRTTLKAMSLREKVGQLIMFSVGGTHLSTTERDLIRRHHLGGVILFADNYDNRTQLRTLTAAIQSVVKRGSGIRAGALISVDQEGGIVKRFPDMPPAYSAPRMGEIGKKSVARHQGVRTGKALRSVGVNIDLAPVADLDLPPEHVMAERSFGSNPYAAGRLVKAFGRGLQRKKVAATAKHFPGLGGATRNSDDGRSYVYRSRHQLHTVDAVPYHKAVAGRFQLFMVSHAMYLNDGGRTPATMSRHISTHRLRKEFGFKGVAISDDLGVVAWRFGGSVAKACRSTIEAGVDIALLAGDAHTGVACANKLYRAVARGGISKWRLNEAVRRVLRLKQWLGVS